VGGPSLTPSTDSALQRAIGIAFSSALGGGGVRNRYRKTGEARFTSDSELILCNLAFRREIYLAEGGLDERLYPNEENELMDRLQREGYHLVHDPELAVHRSQRATYRAYLRQLFGYGRGRGEQTVIAGKLKPVAFAPALLFIYLLLLPFGSWEFAFPFFCYLALMLAASVAGTWSGKDVKLFPWLLLVYPALHLVYGAGTIVGLVRPRFRRQVCDASGVEVKCMKSFVDQL